MNFSIKIKLIILVALFGVLSYFNFYFFPSCVNKLEVKSGLECVNLLDLEFSYSKESVVSLFDALGEEGRQDYVFVEEKIDFIYFWFYTSFLVLLLIFIMQLLGQISWKYLLVLPFQILVFDYLENISILGLLKSYPLIEASKVAESSLFTSAKWISVLLYILSVFVMLFVYFKRKINKT